MLSYTAVVCLFWKDTHYICVSTGSETKPSGLRPPGERNLHFHISNLSFWQQYLLLALQDEGDSKDEHDDSERDGSAGGDEHDDDHDLIFLPMTALSLSQVKRGAADTLALSGWR